MITKGTADETIQKKRSLIKSLLVSLYPYPTHEAA
mgnify:CR=1 FL=1